MSLWPSRCAVPYSLPSERTPTRARISRPTVTAPKTAPTRTESRRFLRRFTGVLTLGKSANTYDRRGRGGVEGSFRLPSWPVEHVLRRRSVGAPAARSTLLTIL